MAQIRQPRSGGLLAILDGCTIVVAVLVAVRLRLGADAWSVWAADDRLPSLVGVLLAAPVLGGLSLWVGGAYRRSTYWSPLREYSDFVRAMGLVVAATLSVLFLLKLQDVSRIALAIFFVAVTGGGLGTRAALRWWRRRRDVDPVRVMFVGTDQADRVLAALSSPGNVPFELVGYVGRETEVTGDMLRLGDLTKLPEVLGGNVVDEVIICLGVHEWERLDDIAAVCEEQGKVMRLPIDVVSYTLHRGRIETVGNTPMLSLTTPADTLLRAGGKRFFDLVLSASSMVLLSPVLLAISLGLLFTQGRPVLFVQPRGGLNGRPFRFLKFRTMVPEAEDLKGGLAGENERRGPAFKLSDDPRVTPMGRWLRRTSLDELPQLWNVLRGDMSLVGPRPPTLDEVVRYDAWHRRRLSVRPGITGLWQVTGRDDPDFDRWVDLDLAYIDGWSFWLDLKILLLTPIALLRTPGT